MSDQRAISRGVAAIAAAAAIVMGTGLAVLPVSAATPALTQVGSAAGGDYNDWVLDSGATGEVWSSPAVGDVTGDGMPEVIIGGLDSTVRVYNASTLALLTKIDPGGADFSRKIGATQASPALGDMNGDGVLDIVLANTGGILSVYSYKNQVVTQLSRRYIPPAFNGALEGIFSTPALGYVNGDTTLDVVTSTWGQEVDAWAGLGLTKIDSMHQWVKDTVWSSPAIGDIDGDGENEIVVGADCEGSGQLQPCYGRGGGGFVFAYNLDGSLKWSYFVSRAVIWSSPALADLTGDGKLDIVVGTGLYFTGNEARKVIALDGTSGRLIWEAPTFGIPVGSPAVADVDGDGRPEVAIVTQGARLYSFDGENGNVRYGGIGGPCLTDNATCPGSGYASNAGVAIADIDGDGQLEALTMVEQKLVITDARTGTRELAVGSTYQRTIFAGSSTPTIATVGGQARIFVTSRGDSNGNRQRDGHDEVVLSSWKSASALGAAPWPTFKQNMFRTGSASVPTAPDPTTTQNFVKQIYQDFLGRTAGDSDVSYWTGRILNRQTSRYDLASQVTRSDEWLTSVITKFYTDTLGRSPDQAGLNGWISAARSGMPVAQIASAFYSSPEYFATVGRSDYRTWVTDLYQKLLLRAPDNGINGWVDALNRGMPRDVLTFGFYQSNEKLGVRITALYQDLLGRAPENGAIANWSPFVANQGDLVLAAALGASEEYLTYAQTPH